MSEEEKIALATQWYNDKTTTEKEKLFLRRLFPCLKKQNEGEKIHKVLLEYFKRYKELGKSDVKTFYGIATDDILAWLEKQGEQKPVIDFKAKNFYVSKVDGQIHDMTYNPTDKAEPKFKVGDWIVNKTYNLVYRVDSILSPQSKCYYLSYNGGTVLVNFVDEQNYRLWTIQDAKDGDVLASELCDSIILFKGIKDDNIDFYCDYDFSKIDIPGDRFTINNGQHYGNVEDSKDFHPATKEQRDTLMKAMADAGYTFDFEKKELKKIEFNPDDLIDESYQQQADDLIDMVTEKSTWSEEDESMHTRCIGILGKCYMGELPTKVEEELKWLKSLRPQANITDEELAQAKKDAYNDALDKIEYHSGEPTFDDGWSAAIWYLKKRNVMPQRQWKPSEEQIGALNYAYCELFKREDVGHNILGPLQKLCDELKKLKG